MNNLESLSKVSCYYTLRVEKVSVDPKMKVYSDILVPIIDSIVYLGKNIPTADFYPASCIKAYNTAYHSEEDIIANKVDFYYFQDAYSFVIYGSALSKPQCDSIKIQAFSGELVLEGVLNSRELVSKLTTLLLE